MATVLCTGVQPTLMLSRKHILEQAGYTVIAALNEDQIVSACRDFRFDVAVIGQMVESGLKRDWSALVRRYCPAVRVLEIYLPGTAIAVKDADGWLASSAIPTELVERVAALAAQGKMDPSGNGMAPLPMSHTESLRELDEQIRRLCRCLIAAHGAEFESLSEELKTALELRDNAGQENGQQPAAL
jgi:hypothetical protein